MMKFIKSAILFSSLLISTLANSHEVRIFDTGIQNAKSISAPPFRSLKVALDSPSRFDVSGASAIQFIIDSQWLNSDFPKKISVGTFADKIPSHNSIPLSQKPEAGSTTSPVDIGGYKYAFVITDGIKYQALLNPGFRRAVVGRVSGSPAISLFSDTPVTGSVKIVTGISGDSLSFEFDEPYKPGWTETTLYRLFSQLPNGLNISLILIGVAFFFAFLPLLFIMLSRRKRIIAEFIILAIQFYAVVNIITFCMNYNLTNLQFTVFGFDPRHFKTNWFFVVIYVSLISFYISIVNRSSEDTWQESVVYALPLVLVLLYVSQTTSLTIQFFMFAYFLFSIPASYIKKSRITKGNN